MHDPDPTRQTDASGPRWIAHVPNALSTLRLLIACLFPWVPVPWRLAAVVTGGLTDLLDGFIARRFGATSVAGGLLDGVADKMLVLSIILTLTMDGALAPWQAAMVLTRDITVTIIVLYALGRGDLTAFRRMPSRISGKVATAMQFLLFVTAVGPWPDAVGVLVTITIVCSALSAGDYLARFVQALREEARSV